MTVIAYKDGIVAADKLGVVNDYGFRTKKLFKFGDTIYAITGDNSRGLELMDWHRQKGEFGTPNSERFAQLIVFRKGKITVYEDSKIPLIRKEKIFACGSGRDYAYGAMYAGASAIQAVGITSKLCTSCGMGISWMRVE